ncbi:MAG: ACP S-malonyltransferase [Ignavibacteriales bacterium]|nr:ACP S-malonyltransferase [Ignavibacteriales bacterium]
MSVAYIFPGQGSQYVGMGKDLAGEFSEARDIFSMADTILGVPLSKICFEGPEEELKQTKNTQPAIFLHSIAIWTLLKKNDAAMVAGHSLGEYSALVAAGALSFEEGLKLVRLRGELMQKAGVEQPGTMAAVIGLDPQTVSDVCVAAAVDGIVQPANFNSPGQIVISGSVAGVRKAMELAKGRGAKMVKELVVSGAFHSPLMQSAREGLQQALRTAAVNDAAVPVYANVTAKPVRSADEIRRLLIEQLTSPVRWEESVTAMATDGASLFFEIGPGKVLQGLTKRCAASVETRGADNAADVRAVLGVV